MPKSWLDEKELEDRESSELLEDELLDVDDAELWDLPVVPKSWLDEKELEDREPSELLEDELLEADDAELWDVLDDDDAPESDDETG